MKSTFHKLLPLLFPLLMGLISCNQTGQGINTVSQNNNQNLNQNDPVVTIKAIVDPQLNQGIRGDYGSLVKFRIDDKPYHALIKGNAKCEQQNVHSDNTGDEMVCIITDGLGQLEKGTYRFVLQNNHGGGLVCTIFEYTTQPLPLVLNISAKTTGECLVAHLETEMGLSKAEIKKRIKNLLNEPNAIDYDVETTTFDLYWYFYREGDLFKDTFAKIKASIIANKPLPENNKSTINGAGQKIN